MAGYEHDRFFLAMAREDKMREMENVREGVFGLILPERRAGVGQRSGRNVLARAGHG
jgi:hypothetical protein